MLPSIDIKIKNSSNIVYTDLSSGVGYNCINTL